MFIAVDFDGTCVTHEFPEIGEKIGAIPVLKKLAEKGHRIILNTMRSKKLTKVGDVERDTLQEAVDWFEQEGLKLYAVNRNPTQFAWTNSPKVHADVFIDDLSLGCPLRVKNGIKRPFVDWEEVVDFFYNKDIFTFEESEELKEEIYKELY